MLPHRRFSLDELRYLGESDAGPSPIEHFLSALGGCICILGSALAQKLGLDVRALEVEVEGALDVRGFLAEDGVRSRFGTVRTRVKVTTREAQERIYRLREEFERRCPVTTMLEDAGTVLDSSWLAVPAPNRMPRAACRAQ